MAKKPANKPKKSPAAAESAPATPIAPAVASVPMAMNIESVAVASLTSDPRNARLHGDKNMASIVASLRRWGQQKPIVVDGDNVVIAGNGTLAAAQQLGWPTITIHRTHLTGAEARAYAIADNRTAELADWDRDELNRTIADLDAADIDLDIGELGWSDDELAALGDDDFEAAHAFAPKKAKDEKLPDPVEVTPTFKVIVTCKTEAEQREIIEWLERRGADYKAPSV